MNDDKLTQEELEDRLEAAYLNNISKLLNIPLEDLQKMEER